MLKSIILLKLLSLVALLIGRLGLSIEQAKSEYATLTARIFQNPLPSGLFDARLFEKTLRELVERYLPTGNGDMRIVDNERACKTCVSTDYTYNLLSFPSDLSRQCQR